MAGSNPTGSPASSEVEEAGTTEVRVCRASKEDGASAGRMSCNKKIKRVRSRLESRKRKVSLIKNNMARDDDLASGKIKASITLLGRRVTKEDTRS
jgi:hypothetical protein